MWTPGRGEPDCHIKIDPIINTNSEHKDNTDAGTGTLWCRLCRPKCASVITVGVLLE